MAASLIDEEKQGICKLCFEAVAKYTCPRCNVPYCSSNCYKSELHASCSEAFYRDCFMNGLKDMESDEIEKKKMINLLHQFEQDDHQTDCTDGDDHDLDERLEGLDLDKDSDLIWSRLNTQEQEQFKMMLRSGTLGNVIEPWEPWWNNKLSKKLIHEISGDDLGSEKEENSMPHILENLPHVSKLLPKGKQSSETIPFNIINVLYGYAYMMRMHNGEYKDSPLMCAEEVMKLCASINKSIFHDSTSSIHSVITFLNSDDGKHLYQSQEFSIGVLRDVNTIVAGPSAQSSVVSLEYIRAALSDIYYLAKSAKKEIDIEIKKSTTDDQDLLKNTKKQLFALRKKLEFYISWILQYGSQVTDCLSVLEIELCSLTSTMSTHQLQKEKLEKDWKGKRGPEVVNKIEELN